MEGIKKGPEEIFAGDGYIYCIDYTDGFLRVHRHQSFQTV